MNNWLQRLRGTAAAEAPAASEQPVPPPGADAARSHFETRYVVINSEASDLDLDRARLLALATIGISEGQLGTHDSLCCELGEHQPGVCLQAIVDHIGRAPLVAFNAAFHRSLFERSLEQHLGRTFEAQWIDLYFVLPALFPERHERPVRLDRWMESFAIEPVRASRALADGWAIAQLFLAVQARATVQGSHTARSLADIERLQRQYRSRL